MRVESANMGALQDFLGDAHQLLGRAQECVQHFQLIGEDTDASDCLMVTLVTLRERAEALHQAQIAGFTRQLLLRLEPADRRNRLHGKALGILEACLSLLAWQVELTDPFSGPLDLDTEEQDELLEHLDKALDPAGSPMDKARTSAL